MVPAVIFWYLKRQILHDLTYKWYKIVKLIQAENGMVVAWSLEEGEIG